MRKYLALLCKIILNSPIFGLTITWYQSHQVFPLGIMILSHQGFINKPFGFEGWSTFLEGFVFCLRCMDQQRCQDLSLLWSLSEFAVGQLLDQSLSHLAQKDRLFFDQQDSEIRLENDQHVRATCTVKDLAPRTDRVIGWKPL